MNDQDIQKIRAEFPILNHTFGNKKVVYLDSAATTQKPKNVIHAVQKYYEHSNANIHRSVHPLSNEATQEYEDAHKAIAKFIGAEFEEVIFTKGTTESINLVASTILPQIQGSEILISRMEHHANVIPWQMFAKKNNCTLKYIELNDDLTLNLSDAKEKITKNTAIVAICHISNTLGTENPIKEIIDIAKENNAITLIDAAQSIQHVKINVKELGCDFLAFSGHKMYGPTGIGVLFGKKELLEKLEPYQFGGDMIATVDDQDATWNVLPWKFEAGTPNIAGAVGLRSAIKFIEDIGLQNIQSYEKELLKYTIEQLNTIEGIKVFAPETDDRAAVVSFTIEGTHQRDVATLLGTEGICIRDGHHCTLPLMKSLGIEGTARISIAVYNTKEDIDTCVKALKAIAEKLKK